MYTSKYVDSHVSLVLSTQQAPNLIDNAYGPNDILIFIGSFLCRPNSSKQSEAWKTKGLF